MTRTHVTVVNVNFGDCDPAGIVFYPNFFRCMDAASLNYFVAAGVPPWHRRNRDDGIVGTPVVDVHATFHAPATYGDRIEVETSIAEWRTRSFVMRHVIRHGEAVLVDGREVRVFARQHRDDLRRLQAVPPPADIRAACER